ncbi:MAG: HPF/RaiA family ribosome-associated protein [Crocinitomicaceae bacterium]|nr:HPF/RaiA family ribosome-associated protein [Crocinitomicaceae bacterium]
MTIILNTDKNIEGHERLESYVKDTVNAELERFNDYVTRIEVHLSDENGDKEGGDDKKCVLEARIKGKQPIAVTSHDDAVERALYSAIEKMQTSLDKIKSKAANH